MQNMACVYSRALCGVDAPLVTVEVHLSNGLPAFNLVGLPEASVREAKERVRSAIINAGFDFPMRRITVNLAPAELPKQGGRYDLAIAIGILAASEQLPKDALAEFEFAGELALSGQLRPCVGLLPMLIAGQQAKRTLVIPTDNANEGQLIADGTIFHASSLQHIGQWLYGQGQLPQCQYQQPESTPMTTQGCLSDIIGQPQAKQALEIAAAGQHNLLFLGPPGTGKTMLASRILPLPPHLSYQQALETAAIYSIAGLNKQRDDFYQRPFRSPHHTSSSVSLIGGGSNPKPGEISLAHQGVLFLDELTEFPRKVLDCLREPLESGEILISRANGKVSYQCQLQLIAAMNPSPCGDIGAQSRASDEQIRRYLSRLSGPFLDRFDLSIDVPRLPLGSLSASASSTGNAQSNSAGQHTSAQVKKRVEKARNKQLARAGILNSQLTGKQLQQTALIAAADLQFLEQSVHQLGLSVRSFHRLQRVARTIADLADETKVQRRHIAQALGYRAMDKLLANLHKQSA